MEKFKNKKMLIGVVVAVLLICGVGGYFAYDNNRKKVIRDKMNVVFTDVKEVEYGAKDYDVKKELVKDVQNADIKDFSKIDTSKIGEQILTFTLVKSDIEKTVEHKINVVDTKAPIIDLEIEAKELIVNEEYDFMSNIKEVKDEVDGNVEFNKDALELNKKATEEYKKLEKDKINDETKIADKSLNDYLIEDVEGKEEKVLYLKNCYYVDGAVDVATAGEYKIIVVAVDKNGIKTTKKFTVNVKEKEIEKPVSSNGGGYTSSGNGGNGSSNGGGSSVARGSIQDVINTAYSIGNMPYVSGGFGPNGFDCNGYIWWAYSQNGYNISTNVASAGYQVAYYPAGTGLDPNIIRPGDIIITEGNDMFGKYKYHARIATGGDTYCSVGLSFSSSGLYEGTKVFNITIRRIV